MLASFDDEEEQRRNVKKNIISCAFYAFEMALEKYLKHMCVSDNYA
jgi:hypothetical protein